MGGEGGIPSLRFSGRLIQPWLGGVEGGKGREEGGEGEGEGGGGSWSQ